jgi:hypothetical protein
MRFARLVFRMAGIYGLLVMPPMYFLESRISHDQPPPITHPEFYYGFIGLCVVWQIAFLLISRDPIRYRPFILVAILEKLSFGLAAPILYAFGRIGIPVFAMASIDLILCVLFAFAYQATADHEELAIPGTGRRATASRHA